MELILLEKVGKLGNIGSVVKVKDGYGRNFLLPKNKAIRATKRNLELFAQRKNELELQDNLKKQAAESVLEKFSDVAVSILRQAGEDGRLYGSVSSRDIAEAVSSATGVEVHYLQISMVDKFKTIGNYNLKLELHPEVIATVTLNIARGDVKTN